MPSTSAARPTMGMEFISRAGPICTDAAAAALCAGSPSAVLITQDGGPIRCHSGGSSVQKSLRYP